MSDDKNKDGQNRKPGVFNIDQVEADSLEEETIRFRETEAKDLNLEQQNQSADFKTGFAWISILFSAIFALIVVSLTDWFINYGLSLLNRNDIIGWSSIAFIGIIILAILMIFIREIFGLASLRATKNLKHEAETALETGDLKKSKKVVNKLIKTFSSRKKMIWRIEKLKKQKGNLLDADALMVLTERELLSPIDKLAKEQVLISARRVSMITAISPFAVLDVLAVTYENLRLLKRISILYGGRPGTLGLFRLGQMVISHLALTGGIALSSDLIQQFLGHKIAAKLSAKLGEGIFNGAMTARIGIATITICRPMPFIQEEKPNFSQIAKLLLSGIVNSK